MIIKTKAYPRVGFLGNPSDGYFGKTLSFCFSDFQAAIHLWESPELELVPSRRDHSLFQSLGDLSEDVRKHGYYGGFRLLKASCKVFLDYCEQRGIRLDDRNFTLRYSSNIPGRVGLAGSSAIITACMRALMGFYTVDVSRHSLAKLVLSVENEELSIPAGLQDRVAQAYEYPVYMDFSRDLMEQRGYGEYQRAELEAVKDYLYVAYREDLSQGTEVYHSDLRLRYERGDEDVVNAIARWAELAREANALLDESAGADLPGQLSDLVNENFDLRSSLYDVGEGNREMVRIARGFGCSAKFAGSGGAITGLQPEPGDECLEKLREAFRSSNITVIRPTLLPGRQATGSEKVLQKATTLNPGGQEE
jgi:glucuronokinase